MYFVIAPGTPVSLDGAGRRDRTNLVLVTVEPDLQPARGR
jgi:hypothetical protein